MKAKACAVPADAMQVVAEADFADAYEAEIAGHHAPLELARMVFRRGPKWLPALMALRNALVRPFGLISATPPGDAKVAAVGFFPVQSVTERRAILGMDDKHLNFRLVADVQPLENGNTRLILSTVIKRHNLLGRVYLAVVLPFHRLLVPLFLNGAARH